MKRLALSLLSGMLIRLVFAQVPPEVSDQVSKLMPKPVPQSPNVASLGRYGDYPVNYYTGLPEISIPIYEAKSGSLSVPITLTYHAGGHRYTDQASWVGLGWSLSAGGQISRATVGKPDEELYYTTPLASSPTVCNNYYYIKYSADGVSDTEPDIFSYSFPGKSGRFLLGTHLGGAGTPYYLVPYEPIKLEPDYSATQFHKFKITDENGVVYNFGKNQAGTIATETTGSDNGGVVTTSKTAWHLMDMTAPTSNDQITFSYQDVGLAMIVDASDRVVVNDLCDWASSQSACTPNNPVPVEILSASTVNQKGLYEILFEGGKVRFVLGPRRNDQHPSADLKSLDKIEIYSAVNGVYTLVRYYQFVYAYFRNAGNTLDLRLKLTELRGYDPNNQLTQRYQFTYQTDTFSWDVSTNSKRRDYLGYYNNRAGNTTLIPTTQIVYQGTVQAQPSTLTIGSADRTTDTTYLKEGMLKRITYPTGGYTEFRYEPHQYQESGATKYPGGLRIRKILSYDGILPSPVIKGYKYGDGETGHGIPNFFLAKSFFMNEQTYDYFDPSYNVNERRERVRIYFSSSTLDLNSYDGVPVVYPVVTEYAGDFTASQGKTVYEFDDKTYEGDQLFVVPMSGKNFKDSRHWKRGKLTKKSVFNVTGSLLATTTITHQLFQSQSKTIGTAASASLVFPIVYNNWGYWTTCLNEVGENIAYPEFNFVNYNQSSGAYRQQTVVESLYEADNPAKVVVTTTSTTYDSYFLVPRENTVDEGTGGTVVTKSKYPFDFSFTGTETGTAKGLKMYKDLWINSSPFEQYTLRNNLIVSGQITTFRENAANAVQPVPDRIYLLESTAGVPEASYTLSSVNPARDGIQMDSRYMERISYGSYSSEGNIIDVAKTNDASVCYVYGYSNSLPIAETKNATLGETTTVFTGNYAAGITMTAAVGTATALSPSFTLSYTSDVSFSIARIKLGTGTPTNTPTLTIQVKNSGGATVWGPNTYTDFGTSVATFNLPAGTYTYYYNGNPYVNLPSYTGMRFDITHSSSSAPFVQKNVLHSSFEDNGTTDPNTRTGGKVWSGTYTFNLPAGTAQYTLSYWTRVGTNPWVYNETTVTGQPAASCSYTIGVAGTMLDELRLYPKNALMTTYTYIPGLGISTATDENNRTTYYVYDSFGRLQQIKNDKGGIEKQYTYYYKAN